MFHGPAEMLALESVKGNQEEHTQPSTAMRMEDMIGLESGSLSAQEGEDVEVEDDLTHTQSPIPWRGRHTFLFLAPLCLADMRHAGEEASSVILVPTQESAHDNGRGGNEEGMPRYGQRHRV